MADVSKRRRRLIPTIYTQPGCVFCRRAKNWFAEQSIPFDEKDITADRQAQDELERLGLHATPAIVIDGQVILGFNRQALEAALQQNLRPSKEALEAADADQGP